jgi:hypothetical protein
MSPNESNAPSSVRALLPLLNSGLELGMCDEAILNRVFLELSATPEILIPAAAAQLGHTAFLLWKSGRGESAKRLMFACLAWYLKNPDERESIDWATGNLQYMLEKEGQPQSAEAIHQAARSR